jgi:hypothetical protein
MPVATMTSIAEAMKISGLRVEPAIRKIGPRRRRPAIRMVAMTSTASPRAFASWSSSGPSPSPAKLPMMKRMRMTARSCMRRMAKLMRPRRLERRSLAVRSCITMAVEDSASASPRMIAVCRLLPNASATAPIAAEVAAICSPPNPKTRWRIETSRCSESSRPMAKSRNTTPSSARKRTPSSFVISTGPSAGIEAASP